MKYALGDSRVAADAESWIAPNAIAIGKVVLHRNASVWWNCVLRGDNEPITIGENTNVQDGCVLHTDPGCPLTLGRNVTIGHMVMLHGCEVADETLIGIGSVILNNTRIGRNCIIGANAFLAEGKEIPDNSVVFGSPGKVVKQVTPEQIAMIRGIAERYAANWKRYRDTLRAEG